MKLSIFLCRYINTNFMKNKAPQAVNRPKEKFSKKTPKKVACFNKRRPDSLRVIYSLLIGSKFTHGGEKVPCKAVPYRAGGTLKNELF
jgi:hypothetical protein